MKTTIATAAAPCSLALDNTTTLDNEGWGLIAPFGEHPKTRLYREHGRLREQKFVQVLDNESADALVARDNSLFGRLKRAVIGVPVFKGHGDLNDSDPHAVPAVSQKIKLGVVDKIRKTARGLEAHFALDTDGAAAVAAGWKLPSAFWWVRPIANAGDVIRCRPYRLISVALTPYPNISGVESLANAVTSGTDLPVSQSEPLLRSATPSEPPPHLEPDMKLIAAWLMAQGVALPNAEAPVETQLLEALKTLHSAQAGAVVALGNEKSTLAGKITAAESERDRQKKLAADHALALANEQAARQADRHAAAGLIVDAAIRLGVKTVAERDPAIAALANGPDFAAAADALLSAPPVCQTDRSRLDISGRQTAALTNEAAVIACEYDAAFKTELAACGQNPVEAHRNIMTLPKYSGLAEKLIPKKY